MSWALVFAPRWLRVASYYLTCACACVALGALIIAAGLWVFP